MAQNDGEVKRSRGHKLKWMKICRKIVVVAGKKFRITIENPYNWYAMKRKAVEK